MLMAFAIGRLTPHTEKVLTVKSTGITEQEVIDVVQKAGFKIEPIIKK